MIGFIDAFFVQFLLFTINAGLPLTYSLLLLFGVDHFENTYILLLRAT
jgi:hypothetical protein